MKDFCAVLALLALILFGLMHCGLLILARNGETPSAGQA